MQLVVGGRSGDDATTQNQELYGLRWQLQRLQREREAMSLPNRSLDARWLKQTITGGHDLPLDQRGNCVGAVLASLLAQPIDVISNTHGDGWRQALQRELRPFGYWLASLDREHRYDWPPGYWIAALPSLNSEGSTHVVICRGNEIVHDPSTAKTYSGRVPRTKIIEMWALMPFDPAVAVEAESHLWAMLVWFGGEYENEYVARDVRLADRFGVEREWNPDEMTKRHRLLTARGMSLSHERSAAAC